MKKLGGCLKGIIIFFAFVIGLSLLFNTYFPHLIYDSLGEMINNSNIKVIEESPSEVFKKVNVNILLSEKLDKNQLKEIAEKIRKFEDKDKFTRLYIFYYLEEYKIGSGAWAYTHYEPELEIKIIGATKREEEECRKKALSVKKNTIGRWYEEQNTMGTSRVLYRKDEKVFLKIFYKCGQESINELKEQKVSNGIKFSYKGKGAYNGEYYILFERGELGFFNKENKQYTTGKIIK